MVDTKLIDNFQDVPNNEKNIRRYPFLVGVVLSINFILFWALPIAGMGLIYKHCLKYILVPLYNILDQNSHLRKFAADYVYSKKEHSDFFAMSLVLIANASVTLGTVFYWQLRFGRLPLTLVAWYYCCWVGFGGRIMGAAYALAHKEGHNQYLYRKPIKSRVPNFFENWLGVFYGNVPWNFTTSHIFIHHRLDGGVGDTFYQWDIDRTSISDFMLYIHRIFMHMIGYSSLKFFNAHGHIHKAELLKTGIWSYWLTAGAVLAMTRSFSFIFWIYLQPLFCMTYFLALLNFGFHGFIDFDENGISIPCVNATTIIEGDDDYFGEDDHMSHHYNSSVYYRDLPQHQKSKQEEFKKYKASVFKGLSIVELSIFVLFGLWDKLAEHFVDYSGTMTKEEICSLLKRRAQRKETTYEKYEHYLANPTPEARKALKPIMQVQEELSQKEKES